jgi:hypothetical protein
MTGTTFSEEWAACTDEYQREIAALTSELRGTGTVVGRLLARFVEFRSQRKMRRWRRRVQRHIPWFTG